MRRFLFVLAVVLVLGGAAHTVGVSLRYLVKGLPEANRVLLDLWIAEAQCVGGALLWAGSKKADPRPWVMAAALVVWSWAAPFLPVLVVRAPPIFWVMPSLYSLAALAALRWSARIRSGTSPSLEVGGVAARGTPARLRE